MTRLMLVLTLWVIAGIVSRATGPETAISMVFTFFAGMIATLRVGDYEP